MNQIIIKPLGLLFIYIYDTKQKQPVDLSSYDAASESL